MAPKQNISLGSLTIESSTLSPTSMGKWNIRTKPLVEKGSNQDGFWEKEGCQKEKNERGNPRREKGMVNFVGGGQPLDTPFKEFQEWQGFGPWLRPFIERKEVDRRTTFSEPNQSLKILSPLVEHCPMQLEVLLKPRKPSTPWVFYLT